MQTNIEQSRPSRRRPGNADARSHRGASETDARGARQTGPAAHRRRLARHWPNESVDRRGLAGGRGERIFRRRFEARRPHSIRDPNGSGRHRQSGRARAHLCCRRSVSSQLRRHSRRTGKLPAPLRGARRCGGGPDREAKRRCQPGRRSFRKREVRADRSPGETEAGRADEPVV